MNSTPNKFDGIDFEFFAIDKNGNIALFVTAGSGFVPVAAECLESQICKVSEQIPTPNIGTGSVWQDYGNVGLHVYDWVVSDSSYVLIQNPIASMPQELQKNIQALGNIPKFNVEFGKVKRVNAEDEVAT